jgi:uncharacterized protein (DUF58 family)
VGEALAADAAEAYLDDQARTGPPRSVVFVVDLSSGSFDGRREETTEEVLAAALAALDPGDEYGVIAAPDALDGRPDWRLFPGEHDEADAEELLDGLSAIDADAPIAEALTMGLESLADAAADDRAPLLVLVTDDEDSDALPKRDPDSRVPVAVVSLGDIGCELPFNEELTARQGLCVDGSRDEVAALVEGLRSLSVPGTAGEEQP